MNRRAIEGRFGRAPERLIHPTPGDVEMARACLNIRLTPLPPQVTALKTAVLKRSIALVVNKPRPLASKPVGGLWTSTHTPGVLSGWLEWCAGNEYSPGWDRPNAFILTPRACRVIVVDSVADLENVITLYADRDSSEWKGGMYTLAPIDFPALARDFDAMHLTEAGQWATHFFEPFSLYGWDCESTLWFCWSFEDDVQHVPTATLIPPQQG